MTLWDLPDSENVKLLVAILCYTAYIYIYILKRFMVLTCSLGELMEDQILQYY